MLSPSAGKLFTIRAAALADVPSLLAMIRELAEFERLSHEVSATEELLRDRLFGDRPAAEVLLAEEQDTGAVAGFALYFQNFSTFLGRPGIYLEDLFVRPPFRRCGVGEAFMRALARLAIARNCGRFEWATLDWNRGAIEFYERLGARRLNDWTICRVTGTALERLAAPSGTHQP